MFNVQHPTRSYIWHHLTSSYHWHPNRVPSSGNLPVMVCNAIMASGMAHLADLIEGGLSHRDAVAKMLKDDPYGWSGMSASLKAAHCNMWRTCTLLDLIGSYWILLAFCANSRCCLCLSSINRQVFQFFVWSKTCRSSHLLLWYVAFTVHFLDVTAILDILGHFSCECLGFRKNSPLNTMGRRTSMWSSLATAIQGNGNKKQQSEVFQIWVLAWLLSSQPSADILKGPQCSNVFSSSALHPSWMMLDVLGRLVKVENVDAIFSAHTWGTQRPKHCQHGIRTRTRPVCENGRGLQAMSKVIKVQSLAGTVRKAGYLHKRRDWSKTRGDVGELHHLFEDWGAAVMCSPWQGWIGWIGWL